MLREIAGYVYEREKLFIYALIALIYHANVHESNITRAIFRAHSEIVGQRKKRFASMTCLYIILSSASIMEYVTFNF